MLQWLSYSQLLPEQWLLAMDNLIRHVSSFKLEKSILILFFILNPNIRVRGHHDGIMAFMPSWEVAGTPVVLLPGWPQTAEAYTEVLPALSERHRTVSIDPPELGDSNALTAGHGTATISMLLEESLRLVLGASYHLVGHDEGAWVAYA
jgi:pimeloyl-ACP methyl ester carboxylesterase